MDPKKETGCDGCAYWYGGHWSSRMCNYIFDVGRSRPCPPGEGCTERRERGGKTKQEGGTT